MWAKKGRKKSAHIDITLVILCAKRSVCQQPARVPTGSLVHRASVCALRVISKRAPYDSEGNEWGRIQAPVTALSLDYHTGSIAPVTQSVLCVLSAGPTLLCNWLDIPPLETHRQIHRVSFSLSFVVHVSMCRSVYCRVVGEIRQPMCLRVAAMS